MMCSFFSQHTGLKKSMFSYNSEGACPECHGKGVLKTELAFMPDFSKYVNYVVVQDIVQKC